SDIEARLEQIRGSDVPLVQLDVVDGVYARNRTWPYTDAEGKEEFARIVSQEEGLPLWDDFDYEIDLMAAHPALEVEKWVDAGAVRVVVHLDADGAREALEKLRPYRGGDDSLGIKVGVALSSTASVDELLPIEGLYDFVQVMGIERVGFQGQSFDPRCAEVIKALRAKYPDLQIQVDGGVKEDNAHILTEAGANRLVVGGAIFGSLTPRRALEELKASV
ncbi:MAG TPA: hypothetical protein VF803_01065, partial [Candidatus Paceibacterota bacterium]